MWIRRLELRREEAVPQIRNKRLCRMVRVSSQITFVHLGSRGDHDA